MHQNILNADGYKKREIGPLSVLNNSQGGISDGSCTSAISVIFIDLYFLKISIFVIKFPYDHWLTNNPVCSNKLAGKTIIAVNNAEILCFIPFKMFIINVCMRG